MERGGGERTTVGCVEGGWGLSSDDKDDCGDVGIASGGHCEGGDL